MAESAKSKVLIIGAGISGIALAILLHKRGHEVELIEKRNYEIDEIPEKHSINFTLTQRGLDVLESLHLKQKILQNSDALTGRMIHAENGKTLFYPYGSKKNHMLHSIRRRKLLEILYEEIKQYPNIPLKMNCKLLNINKSNWECKYINTQSNKTFSTTADLIVGADGAFSTTRKLMLDQCPVSYQQKFFNWKYKKIFLPADEAKNLNLATENLHIWSYDQTLLVAIPNPDGSFGLLFAAQDTHNLDANTNLNAKFHTYYSDLLHDAPSLSQTIQQAPVSYFVSIKIGKWVYANKVILIGDACHAVFPFYGQGMNCALEDAVSLNFMLQHSKTPEKALRDFEHVRKPNADALDYLSETHFYHLQKAYSSPWLEARNQLDCWLTKWFPKHWKYEYEMVAHTHIPYQKILRIVKRQNRQRKFLGLPLIELLIVIFSFLKKLKNKQGNKYIKEKNR